MMLKPSRLSIQRIRRYSRSVSSEEVSHFNALASTWWDVNGSQRILHKMNLLRMDFIQHYVKNYIPLNQQGEKVYIPPYNTDLLPPQVKQTIQEEQDLKREEYLASNKFNVLDVGCGGGILSESLARLDFISSVKGIDLSPEVLEAAKLHQKKDPMLSEKLHYQLTGVEDLSNETYDIITMFEVLEHVLYPSEVLEAGLERLNLGGWLFLSTINRDFVSWFTTIFFGEHVLKIVPKGTHTLEKYIDHDEIARWVSLKNNQPPKTHGKNSKKPNSNDEKYKVAGSKGCIYLPACGWKFTSNPRVGNYMMAIRKN